ncbi:uncharacterized protein LOC135495378 [Lineus longissimus]|uniref:uncharacterized protein LOC135495378 n=1 Tax=Lineus longissimus TaxID=88925 RepID=UPI00315DBCED
MTFVTSLPILTLAGDELNLVTTTTSYLSTLKRQAHVAFKEFKKTHLHLLPADEFNTFKDYAKSIISDRINVCSIRVSLPKFHRLNKTITVKEVYRTLKRFAFEYKEAVDYIHRHASRCDAHTRTHPQKLLKELRKIHHTTRILYDNTKTVMVELGFGDSGEAQHDFTGAPSSSGCHCFMDYYLAVMYRLKKQTYRLNTLCPICVNSSPFHDCSKKC